MAEPEGGDRGFYVRIAVVLGVTAAQVLMTNESARFRLKLWWKQAKAVARAWTDAEETGRKVAEWFVREEAPKVVARAEEITKEAAP